MSSVSNQPEQNEQSSSLRHFWDHSCTACHWLLAHGWVPILALLIAMAALWGFLALADEVGENETEKFDVWAFEHIATYESVGGFWQEAGRDLTALGGTTVITLMVTFVTIFLLAKRQWKSAIFVLVAVLGGLVISLLLKEFFDRNRPDLVTHQSHVMTSSFPSGHAANSAVAYLTMAILLAKLLHSHRLKAYVLGVGLLIPFLVGYSRVFVGVHWPTDVVAGWLLGLFWGLIVHAAATLLQKRGAIEPEGMEDVGPDGVIKPS